MELDIRDFLRKFSWGELRGWSIHPDTLQGQDVAPLINFMKKHQVTRLVADDRGWFLTSDGEFSNPGSQEIRRGHVKDLLSRGNVFLTQNPYINPHYKDFRFVAEFPIAQRGQDRPVPSPRTDAQPRVNSRPETPARRGRVSRDPRSSPVQWGPHLNATDGTTESLVNLCKRRAQQFLDLEDELREMQASMSDDAGVDKIRRDIQQRKINFIADFTNHQLANPHLSSDVALRPIYDILDRLNLWGVEVYDCMLRACETRNTADLDIALDMVRNCQSETEYAFQEIPQVAKKQRSVAESHPRTKGGCMGAMLGLVVGTISCTSVIVIEPDNSGLVPFPLEYALYRIFVSPVSHSRASRNPELEAAFQYQHI